MPDFKPNAWVVEFRDPINKEWLQAAHYPAIDIVEIDGFEVRTRFTHFEPFAKRVGDTINLVGKYDG
jgi:hypothetical protein